MDCDIKPVGLSDIKELMVIGKTTFLETFAHLNTADNINAYTAKAFSEHQTKQDLETNGSTFFFICKDNETCGYLKLNTGKAQTECVLQDALEIERIYVLNKFHGLRLGKALFDFAIKTATDKNMKWLWLGVWDENDKAIEFYKRQGLQVFGQHEFKLGDELQSDVLMKLAL